MTLKRNVTNCAVVIMQDMGNRNCFWVHRS